MNLLRRRIFAKISSNGKKALERFSYSQSDLGNVIRYIQNQKEHHKKTFKEEYIEFLTKFEIEFKNEYLFEWIE